MTNQSDIEILPEDRVQLTTDQKNLIALAFEKQLPFEDAEFLEKVQKKTGVDSYTKIHEYFVTKYGSEFGEIFLATITGGEESCKEAISTLEQSRAFARMSKETGN